MIKSLFFKMFRKEIDSQVKKSFDLGVAVEKESVQKRKSECAKTEAEILLNKPVIILTNEWNNPIVGELIQLDFFNGSHPLYGCQDYIQNKVTYCLTKPLAFSMQKLVTLGKLNPDEICALFFEGRDSHGNYRKHPNYGKENPNKFTNYEDWIDKMKKNGFFDKFGEFIENEEKTYEQEWNNKVLSYGC